MVLKAFKPVCFGGLIMALAAGPNGTQAAALDPLTIRDVTVIPMTDGARPIAHATVEIKDGRIVSVTTGAAASACAGTCIDGHGRWLIPGLTDAHVHLENDRLMQLYMHLPARPVGAVDTADMGLPFVANGITQVFDLSAMSETLQQKADFDSGRVAGPHIVTAYMLDGPTPIWPEGMSHGIPNPEAGRQAVRDAVDERYDLIKVYSLLDLPTFLAIVDEARKHNVHVIGHIPGRGQGMTASYFVPGYDAVAHAEEFAFQTNAPDEQKIPAYVAMSKANHTALVSTLTVDDDILAETADPASLKTRADLSFENPLMQAVVQEHNPYVAQASPARIAMLNQVVHFNVKLVKAFSNAGVPVLAGTDSPVPGVAPGFALIDELQALARAGLTPYQALYSATRAPCDWLGPQAACGTIAPGQRADLLLLDADPSRDIANIRRLSAVIIGGKVYEKTDLDGRMTLLKARFARKPQ